MTHDELVERAHRWLAGTRHCYVVLTESEFRKERVDAIGFYNRWSILIECKVSWADFVRDRKKACRQPDYPGMGQERYFLTPPKLIPPDRLPAGWGLLEARTNQVRRIVNMQPTKMYNAVPNPHRSINEVGFLVNHWKGSNVRNLRERLGKSIHAPRADDTSR